MAIHVPLLTISNSSQSTCSMKWIPTLTSTCSTSRLYGVHSQTKNIREICVFTHTTGRTIDAHLISSNILIFSAQAGNKRRTLKHTKMGASQNTDVDIAMDGKNLSTTRLTTKLCHVVRQRTALATSLIVPTIIVLKNNANLFHLEVSSDCILAIEVKLQVRQFATNVIL